ncbi:MAG: DUF934 domain-containing protein [Pseudomonadota bacterium]
MLLRDGTEIEDTWVTVADAEMAPVPEGLPDGGVIVPFEVFRELRASRTTNKHGISITNDIDPAVLEDYLDDISLIAIPYPSFADGRGFSLAKRIKKMGFTGTLRATGHVIADQAAFAEACGFDEIKIDDDVAARQSPGDYASARQAFPRAYQTGFSAADQKTSILEARHGR